MTSRHRWFVPKGGRHCSMAELVRGGARRCVERTGVEQVIHYHASTERCARGDHEVVAP